jgi:hypothetical protein
MSIFISPKELLEKTESEMEKIPVSKFFNDPSEHFQKLRESWIAAKYGTGMGSYSQGCLVKIIEDRQDSADFLLRLEHKDYRFQSVEVVEENRKRGLEMRSPTALRSYRPEKGRIEGPGWVHAAVAKKVAKKYSDASKLNLLIYLDFNAAQFERDGLISSLQPFANSFASVWCITNWHICSLFLKNSDLPEIAGWAAIHPNDQLPAGWKGCPGGP